ncbi:alpha/beta fold hydrolase [Microbispora sp. RL4-1S]|uniref:Alpha/beta fold hydrolase n=1 Tax=Microbispora oryzae TaxID=2806554 RepID=A0A941AKA7_9ACTN|nr:alpha/beta fold hydrolase [Microbispora oryzae]MBP2707021.1 alpha/beta fold hydrolase [Microbispora oryzae]
MSSVAAYAGLAVSGPAALAAPGPSIEDGHCPVAEPSGTTCGFLLVPERRDVPNSRTIKVAFAVHKSASPNRRPDPVVYMSGGPGSASLQLTGFVSDMVPDHDVVVLDQRGGRHSEPRLSCPEIPRAVIETLTTPGPTAKETAPIIREALTCQSRLVSEHVDLRGYNTAEIAADIVDLRRALGYQQWNLFGVSYSTRPMLLAASRDPQGTRAVVLDSFLPQGSKWYDQAGANLRSSLTKLGIAAKFDQAVARLNGHPAGYLTVDPLSHKRIDVTLNGDDVATLLGEALQESDVIPILPALVEGLADGKTELLQPIVDEAGDALTSHDWGLYYAVQCQDEVPFNAFPAQSGPRLFTGVVDATVCGAWKLPASRDSVTGLAVPAPTATSTDAGALIHANSPARRARLAFPAGTTPATAQATATRTAPTHAASARTASARTASARAGAFSTAREVTSPVLVLGGSLDPTAPPEAARQAATALPGARFAEFSGVGHAVFLSSACGRATIAAFLDDPSSTAAPCDAGKAPYAVVRPGDLFLTEAAYRVSRSPGLVAPMVLFVVVSIVQLLAGLFALIRRRGGAANTVAGLAGVGLIALAAVSVYQMPDYTALAVGVPHVLLWCGPLAVLAAVPSTIEAFRLHARGLQIVPVLSGLAFLAWLYGWVLV